MLMQTGANEEAAAEQYGQLAAPAGDTVQALVYDYLVHHCYVETAQSFGAASRLAKAAATTTTTAAAAPGVAGAADEVGAFGISRGIDRDGDSDMGIAGPLHSTSDGGRASDPMDLGFAVGNGASNSNGGDGAQRTLAVRRAIYSLVASGRLSEAVALCDRNFPGLLDPASLAAADVCFEIKCQQFIECVRLNPNDALAFAQIEFARFASMSQKYNDILQDVVALIAYTNPETSPLAAFMSHSRREQVAMILNNHILGILIYFYLHLFASLLDTCID
eukprot:jgi/Hompol1/4590/HPOL_003735-RA